MESILAVFYNSMERRIPQILATATEPELGLAPTEFQQGVIEPLEPQQLAPESLLKNKKA